MAGFLTVKGDQFVLSDDESQVVKLKGTNFQTPHHPHFKFREFDWNWVERGMKQVQNLGMNCVREIINKSHPNYTEAFSRFLDVAEKHGVRAYVIPGWPHLYADAGTREDKANIQFIRELVSSVKNDPRVLAWDMTNEPDWVGPHAWQWNQAPEDARKRLEWFRRMIEEIKGIDTNHPVSVGTVFNYSYWMPDEPFTLESIVDFVDVHYYRRNSRRAWLRKVIRDMKQRTDKPILIGEFGFPTDENYSVPGEPVHNEAIQFEMYKRFITDIRLEKIVGFMQWALTDCVSGEPGITEKSEYGILRPDLGYKPAAEYIRNNFAVPKLW